MDCDVKTEPSTSTDSSRLGLCEVCVFHDAKYTCPRCEVKTCSLKCNKIHKLELECNGERDKAKFIPLKKFTDLDLANDYRFLEEISRTVQLSKKNYGKRPKYDITPYMVKLKKEAKKRNIDLKFLPFKFARRRNNSTDFRRNIFYWHIDWIFTNADNLKLVSTKVAETEKIGSVLHKLLSQSENEETKNKLRYYEAVGMSGLKVYLKAEQKKGKMFFELDLESTISECLQRKLIIEYPMIHVVLKDHSSCYDVIDSDCDYDEEKADVKPTISGNDVINNIIKRADSNESLYRSLKNLLFVSEYSDEEAVESD